MPKSVAKRVEKTQRDFLWGGGNLEGKVHLVKWDAVCTEKHKGGLGLRRIATLNRALLGKWIWRFACEKNNFWNQVITTKYGQEDYGWRPKKVRGPAGVRVWKEIMKEDDWCWDNLAFRVGKGSKIKFWKDCWCTDTPLSQCFNQLFVLAVHRDATIEEMWDHDAGQGDWKLVFVRDFNDWEMDMVGELLHTLRGQRPSLEDDSVVWRQGRNGIFKIKEAYRLLDKSNATVFPARKIWVDRVPTKVCFFAWEATWEKVLTLDRLQLRGVQLPNCCYLCGCEEENANFDFHGEDWEWGTYKAQRVQAVGEYSNDDGLHLEKIFIQNDNATIHADGTLLGPKTNLHFAVLNFPVSLVPTLVQVIESSATDAVHSLRQFLAPIKGILHMEGDLRGSIAKPECNVEVRLLDGAIGGIDLGRAEIVASLTSTSRFLFNAKFEPFIQNGYVHIQGSVPVAFVQNNMLEEEDIETWIPGWVKERGRGPADDVSEKKISRDRNEEGWDTQLAESLKGLNWNILDVGEVRIDADIKDGGMMMLTALSPYADWLHGNADIMLQVRGTVEQPVINGSASFHRASVSSPVLWKPLTNFGGTVHVKSNRLCISSLESRVGRRGKLFVKGNLPLRISEASLGDKIDLKCEVLEVRAKNILSGQVDTQMQITGSILQPNISGNIKLSHGEAYLPPDKGTGAAPFNRLASVHPSGGYNPGTASRYLSWFPSSEPAPSSTKFPQPSGKQTDVEKEMEQVNRKPKIDIRLTDLKLVLGPELRILYPLILDFAVSGELELNGIAHPKLIKPKGVLTFESGEVNLVATQVRLKKEHLNIAKFEPDNGLDPTLDLALVGSEWQFRIQSRASNWQDNLVVTSTRAVEQEVLSPTEAARVFESQLAESILEGDGKLSFKKLATATLETLMPRIEGKGEFGQARWRIVYAPQIFSLLSVDPTVDPLKSLASNISFGTEVEIKLGKRLQASIVRQMKDSEMAMQFTLTYQLTSRLRVLLQSWSVSSQRLLFEYSSTSQN
uniref:Uncharacterized protein n=1 Tax=Vitis vinifera TaxID=29760 RepID=F6H3G0_VITVI